MAEGRTRLTLMDGAAGQRKLLVESDGAEGLLVLGEVVGQHVYERLCLLRTEVDALEVFDAEFVGRVLAHGAEDEQKVPDGHAHLDTVCISVAIIGGGREIEFRLGGGLGLAHYVAFKKSLVRKGGLEPPRVTPPDPKSGASANFATFALDPCCLFFKT